ncbi:MAG: pirin family protein [Mesorhizobium sp.]|nr:MAG: pirin family protein [Mesorhizobium sp.]
MSPGDLGQALKPFVFLDIFDADRAMLQAVERSGGMPIHPHSGVATVTVITEGHARYDDPAIGAGGGVWHGKEMTAGDVSRMQGFQLWLALPPELENGPAESRYIDAGDIPYAWPAHIIVGKYEDVRSPVPAPDGINYLLVTMRPGESWSYEPPPGHSVGWLALAKGTLDAGSTMSAGEMAIFENGEAPISLQASGDEDAVFVLGSAVPHPHPLHLGYYSVHTSAEALAAGERRIAELGQKLKEAGDRQTASGSVPVFR